MTEPSSEQKNNERHPSLSDWITFLSNEKGISLTAILGLGAMFVTFAGVVVTTQGISTLIKVIIDLILFVILISFFRLMRRYGKRREASALLLKEIMIGTLNDPDRIKERWEKESEQKMPKKKRWTMYSIAIFAVGLIILVEGAVDLLSTSEPHLSKGWWYIIFAVAIFLVAFIWKDDEHP